MKPSKLKKKLRWLERESKNPKRARVIRDMAQGQIERIKRRGKN